MSKGGRYDHLGSRFKKGCALFYFSTTKFKSTLAVKLNGIGAVGAVLLRTMSSWSSLFWSGAVCGGNNKYCTVLMCELQTLLTLQKDTLDHWRTSS